MPAEPAPSRVALRVARSRSARNSSAAWTARLPSTRTAWRRRPKAPDFAPGGERRGSSPNSERHRRTSERATAALAVRTVMPPSSTLPAASTRPASSAVGPAPRGWAVRAASWRRISEANEGKLAYLPGQPIGVVAYPVPGLARYEIRLPDPDPEGTYLPPIHLHRRRPLDPVTLGDARRQRSGVDENVGDDGPGVFGDGAKVVRDRQTVRLPRLRHHVRHVQHRPAEGAERLAHPAAQERGDGAREQAPGAQDDHVRVLDGLDRPRRRLRSLGLDRDPFYRLPGVARCRLAPRDGPVGVVGEERQTLGGGREHPPLDAQEASCLLHALEESPGHVRQRRDDDVPDRVLREVARRALEAVVEDLGQPLAPGQRHEAVPHVARRRDAKLLAQAPARAPVVRDGHDRRQVPDAVAQAP